MNYLFYIASIVTFIAFAIEGVSMSQIGYYQGCEALYRMTYMFAHANILHLIVNIYASEVIYRLLKRRGLISLPLQITMPLAGFIMTYGTELTLPTVGMSGVAFFLYGVLFASDIKHLWQSAVLTALLNIVPYLLGAKINILIHLVGFLYGILFYLIYYKTIKPNYLWN